MVCGPASRDAVSMTEEETERRIQALLDADWQSIAASGWTRYQLYGRGALLASIHMLEGRSNSMDYITAGAGAALPAGLEAEISSYEPRYSVVLVFVQDDVFQRATQPVGAELLTEHIGVLSGEAYMKVVTRLPPPPECAKGLAH